MKIVPIAAAAALALAGLSGAAFADDAAEATAAAFTIEMPIATLMADDRAKAVLAKHLGPVDQHPAYDDFKAMSLKVLAPFSQGLITEEVLGKIETDLTAIK